MKQGIYLGPPRPKLPAFLGALGAALAAVALVFGLLTLRVRRESTELRNEIARLEDDLSTTTMTGSTRPAVASRLEIVLASGLLDAVQPTRALRLLGRALPTGVSLSNVTLHGTPPNRSLTLEATARGASEVTELQRRVSSSPMVSGTTLLEERRLPDGNLAVRLQADLRGPETR